MRHARLIPLLMAALLYACGSPQLPSRPASLPTAASAASAAPAPTISSTSAALVASPALNEGQVPEPSPTPPAAPSATSAPPTAEPTAAPVPPQPAPSAPIRLVIEDIGMDRSLVSVGLDKNRVPIVPKHDVGWYNLSAMPGQGDNVVLWGHVLRFKSAPKIPAPFARLKELQPGARVVLYDEVGNAHAYVVPQQVWATPDQVEYILPQGTERITMVSCIGDKVVANGDVEMTHRLITIAEPQS